MFHLNTLEQGGAERVVSNLANEFSKGDDEIIVATQWFGEDEFKLNEKVRRIHVGLKDSDENKSRITKAVLRLKYLRDTIKAEKPDVVIAFAQKAIYRAGFAMMGLDNKLIVCVRTDPKGHYDQLIDKISLPLINKRADGAVFQTVGQRDFFSKHWQDISTIILNPVNDKYFIDDTDIPKTKTIVQHARLVDFKNQPMLIDAFMQVHAKYPEYDLKIYGPDSFDGTKKILENKIKEYKAEDFITLCGGSDELEKLVPKASIYAFSSDWEGLPNTLIEALTMGMCVVATDCPCGGPRTIMPNTIEKLGTIEKTDRGILVPIMNSDAMAQGIIYMIENPEYANSCKKAAMDIRTDVLGSSIVSKWKEYILKVIDK